MKSAHVLTPIPSTKYLGFLALVAVAVGCERRRDEPMPPNPAPLEAPATPRIDSAKPGAEATAGAGSVTPTDPGQSPTTAPMGETAAGDRREAQADFKSAQGYKLSGEANLEEVANGVKIVVEIEDAPAGKRGIHVHEKGDCSDIPGKSMGEHFAPDAKEHGLLESPMRHLGDLGNIEVAADGTGAVDVLVPNATLDHGTHSFVGKALVIHEKEHVGTGPSGESGTPIACGVIRAD